MLDPKTLAYDLDEDRLEFGAKTGQASPAGRVQNLSAALIGLGLLIFCLAALAKDFGWAGLLGSFGPMAIGALLLWRQKFRGTTPGIKNDGMNFSAWSSRSLLSYGLAVFITGFYCVLYFGGSSLGSFHFGGANLLDRPASVLDPLAFALSGKPADKWFLYGFLYTICVLIFGVRMFWKYRHNRYQIIRTASVMVFQLGLAFVLPQLLKGAQQPEHYFTYFWPLKPDYLFPAAFESRKDPMAWGMFFLYWSAIMTFVATPVLTYFYGKRWYCSWVCGCGGLAETLGDPWRQLSDKSTRAWKIERVLIHSVLVLIVFVTAWLWIDYAGDRQLSEPAQIASKLYGFFIGAAFSGVIGVGFYPILGSRVWCRFGCPMAAILGLFQRYFSRFRITTNGGQCISCGNCSTYCEMGIDVRAYAQRGENIVRASCVGCGICSAVCPRGVLKLENGPTHKDRYEGAERGFAQVLADLEGPKLPR